MPLPLKVILIGAVIGAAATLLAGVAFGWYAPKVAVSYAPTDAGVGAGGLDLGTIVILIVVIIVMVLIFKLILPMLKK